MSYTSSSSSSSKSIKPAHSNYDQGLGMNGRWQTIPLSKEASETFDSKQTCKTHDKNTKRPCKTKKKDYMKTIEIYKHTCTNNKHGREDYKSSDMKLTSPTIFVPRRTLKEVQLTHVNLIMLPPCFLSLPRLLSSSIDLFYSLFIGAYVVFLCTCSNHFNLLFTHL